MMADVIMYQEYYKKSTAFLGSSKKFRLCVNTEKINLLITFISRH